MASIATVVTMGYGSFGSVNLIPTLGYGIGAAVVEIRYRVVAADVYCARAITQDESSGKAVAQDVTT